MIRIDSGKSAGDSPGPSKADPRVVSGPAYMTFDIDSVDPAFAPGTGTPEVGGLTSTRRSSSSESVWTGPSWWRYVGGRAAVRWTRSNTALLRPT